MNSCFSNYRKHFLLLLVILLSIQLNFEQLDAQTKNWYVDKNATGTNDGTSWTNAYEGFSSINWAQPIDTIFISGGTDSTVYQETLTIGASGTADKPIVITKGKDAGHNGLVVIDGQSTRRDNINIVSKNYVKIINLKLKNPMIYDHIGNNGRNIYAYLSDNIEIDSCEIIYNATVGIMMITCDNAKITYNNIYQDATVTSLTSDMGISLKWSSDNVEIAYNTIIMRNTNNGNAIDCHKDLIFVEGLAPYNVNGSIHHNFLMHDIPTTVERESGIYCGALEGTWEVYNNVLIVKGSTYNLPLSLRSETASNNFVAKLYNNTIVGGTSDFILDVDYADSLFVYNNIFYKPVGTYQIVQINNTPAYLGMNYNRYYIPSGSVFGANGTTKSFINWQAAGYDVNSSVGAVTFTDLWSTTLADWKTTGAWTGIDLGNSIPMIADDIENISRNQGPAYDLGAFESDITPPQLVSAQLIDSITIVLEFSEQMNVNSVENPFNYSISNGLSVFDAVRTGNQIRLSTSQHTNGTYQVTVNNVTDIAGNLISTENNSYQYEYNNPDSGLLNLPIYNATAENWYQNYTPDRTIDGLTTGDSRWGGARLLPDTIMYSLGNVQILNYSKIAFYEWNNGRIYQYTLQVSTDSINWQSIKENILSSSQEWSVDSISPIEARYVRIISLSNNQNAYAGIYEAEFWGYLKIATDVQEDNLTPVSFKLEQNYPNPFNPSTKIRYNIPSMVNCQLSNVVLKVYDILGNEVATLVNEEKPVGSYEVEFRSENLASGVYVYRIQTSDPFTSSGQVFSEAKKMVLLR